MAGALSRPDASTIVHSIALVNYKMHHVTLFLAGLWKTSIFVDGCRPLHYTCVMKSMKALLAEIEAYLAATGIAPTRFGVDIDGDRHLVRRIRSGRPVTMAKAERIIDYIRSNPPPKRRGRARRRIASALSLVA